MKTIVTGGAGFIGNHLVKKLVSLDHEVLVIDDLSRGDAQKLLNNLSSVRKKIDLKIFSIGIKVDEVHEIIIKYCPDVIYNLAACSFVNSTKYPIMGARSNILGTLSILEAMRSCDKMPLLVHASTGSVYGKRYGIVKENHRRTPTSGYGVSKACAEEYLRVWHDLYGIPFVGLRYYNVYGAGQPPYAVIPIFIDKILSNSPIKIYGDGEQTRRFTHVSDIVDSTYNVSYCERAVGEFFNLAEQTSTSILDLSEMIMEISGIKVPIEFGGVKLGDIKHFSPDTTKAIQQKIFNPKTSLSAGLKDLIEGRRKS